MPTAPPKKGGSTLLAAVCWGTLLFAHAGAVLGWETVGIWFYPLVWWPYVILMDHHGARLGVQKPLLSPPSRLLGLGLLSVPFWLLFELLNLRLENWYYVGVPENWLLRNTGAALSFATVLPLMAVTAAWLRTGLLGGRVRVPRLRITSGRLLGMRLGGGLFLLLPMVWPHLFFPLVWGFLVLLLEPANYQAGRPSLLADLERGDGRRVAALLSAGLICGGLWEGWNVLASAHWIYTVPWLTETRWFEMPPLGFLGFPMLALEGFVCVQWMAGNWREARKPARGFSILLLIALSVCGLWGMDRYTVDAHTPSMDNVRPLNGEQRAALKAHGVVTVRQLAELDDTHLASLGAAAGIDAGHLTMARDWARLTRHRGLGDIRAARLWDAGITRQTLAMYTPEALTRILGDAAPPRQRIRVWLHAAPKAVDPAGG
ncbi:MAG: DUF4332 domain-containing protein [Nitrospirota bacterium]|nr:DUF4332 domain-containing protein [Nitrospirota bacterium]